MSAVDQLALVCGVTESSLDAFGKEHRTSPELKKALLGAMGFPVRDEDEAAQMLADLQAKDWTRPLPPVLVAHASAGSVLVPMVVPRLVRVCVGRWFPRQAKRLMATSASKTPRPWKPGRSTADG